MIFERSEIGDLESADCSINLSTDAAVKDLVVEPTKYKVSPVAFMSGYSAIP